MTGELPALADEVFANCQRGPRERFEDCGPQARVSEIWGGGGGGYLNVVLITRES